MDWKKAVTTLKAHVGVETDKALYEAVGFHNTNLASIKRGGATFGNVERLCKACGVNVSTFISWGEK